MIGNDVVDLALAKKKHNWKRSGFLNKVFTEREQNLITTAEDPTKMVWSLWSQKESIYKIIARREQKRSFAPKSLNTSSEQYHIETFYASDYIWSFAAELNYLATCKHWTCKTFLLPQNDYPTQHRITKNKLLQHFAQLSDLLIEELCIKKDAMGIPFVFHQEEQLPVLISIAMK